MTQKEAVDALNELISNLPELFYKEDFFLIASLEVSQHLHDYSCDIMDLPREKVYPRTEFYLMGFKIKTA